MRENNVEPVAGDSINFLVLGSVEVTSLVNWHGGIPPKTRQLLAVLLMAGRNGMSSGKIATCLWGEAQPPSAPQMVRARVMKLRSMLGPDKWRITRDASSGYRIKVADHEIDAGVFERLLREGHRELAAGKACAALPKLQHAIGLWRGNAAMVGTRDVVELEAEAVRLEELRLLAEELIAEAQLALGRAAEVIPHLLSLTVMYPLREQFLAQLMLALVMCGRCVEAADVYVRARKRFIEEVGMEPSAALARVHDAVLRGDEWQQILPVVARVALGHGERVAVAS
jgi:DNA-binding SARP family transcriptional activator